ncbi:hypothetical protein BROUX41_002657 [Berkeleyomyces rouxiae]|uniref:uncharacterized protein n=1 Tax=Berkeleyomyces rouxiae TaxID=2035830 RepID=UPI003B8040A1
MADYTEFLAAHILAQDEVVTYRTLSRALKVNVHVAKQMLYDFHATQNAAKPGSIVATYVVFGKLKSDAEDAAPEPESAVASEPIETLTLSMIAQSRLEETLASYESVKSLHIYSLGTTLGNDLQMISDAPRLCEPEANRNPIEDLKLYGSIVNSHTRRRSRRSHQPIPTVQREVKPQASTAKQNAKPLEPGKSTTKLPFGKAPPQVTESTAQPPPVEAKASSSSGSQKTQSASSKKAPGKAGNSIMQSFAKAASLPAKPKAKVKDEPASADSKEDTAVLSDDGEDDEASPDPELAAEAEAARKAREAKQSQLRRMMDEDDEEDDEPKEEEDGDVSMHEAPSGGDEEAAPAEPEKLEVVATTVNGRKRGRRQVMKKKQTMDANGYFVTIQEKAWESFSEDEEQPPASKPKTTAAPASSAAAGKAKKAAPKGQGNIMSFFQKR